MKIKNKKKFLCCILLIIILVAIVVAIFINSNNKKNSNTSNSNSNEQFASISENGKKTNNSSKIKETKNVENLEFSNIKITSINNQTTVTADVKNPTKDTIKGFYFKLKAVDSSGNVLAESEGLLDSVINAKSSSSLEVKTSKDFANCYDIQIEKIKDAD